MSIVHCNHCNKDIDTDFEAEHFIPDTEHCLIQVEEAAPDLLKALKKMYGIRNLELTEDNAEEIEGIYNKAKQLIKQLNN